MFKHLKENNETYFSHMFFAFKVGLNLLISSMFFVIHGIIPVVSAPQKFNLDSICKKINKWNDYAQKRKNT